MSLRWWQNSKRSETIQRRATRSSAVLFKKGAEPPRPRSPLTYKSDPLIAKQALNGRYKGP